MTTTPNSKRMSVDVSDLVDQLRPYTPYANRKALREGPLISFDANTAPHIFSSPLPPANGRGRLTAGEAAKEVLDSDPFLNFRSISQLENQLSRQKITKKESERSTNSAELSDRVSPSFQDRTPRAALAFSPVVPKPTSMTLPSTEPLPPPTPSTPSYSTRSYADVATPVSAAKPPRPPVPRLQPLHSPSEKPSQAFPSSTPSTPFGSTIPLTYSAVKTPGAASLKYLGETPASAKQSNDPSTMVEFFRSRSAHVTSPIFSTKKKIDCEDLGSPEIHINPLAESTLDDRAIPKGVEPEVVVQMDFSQEYGFDRAEEKDLSSRANRVPILYAIAVKTTDLGGDIHPVYARLERDADSAHTMLIDIFEGEVQFAPARDIHSPSRIIEDSTQEATLTFWAAPDSFVQFGSAALLLTVTDRDGENHETKVELHVIGTEPVITVEAKGNDPKEERKETTVTFEYLNNHAEEHITVWNQTLGGAPILINALVTDSASGTFSIHDHEGGTSSCIPMMIPAGGSYTFTASFELVPDTTIRGRYYGCILLKLATLMPSRGRHTASDIDLHQFYDHVLNLEAQVAGVTPPDRFSSLEDPSSSNIEEMLYEHRYGNEYDGVSSQSRGHIPSYSEGNSYHHDDGADQEGRGGGSVGAGLKRLSLIVPEGAVEPVPGDVEERPYMVCEYNLDRPPRWTAPHEESCEGSYDHEYAGFRGPEGDNQDRHIAEESETYGDNSRVVADQSKSHNFRRSLESYEEWKRSLEDADTACNSDNVGYQDSERLHEERGSPHSNSDGVSDLALDKGRTRQSSSHAEDSLPQGAESYSQDEQVESIAGSYLETSSGLNSRERVPSTSEVNSIALEKRQFASLDDEKLKSAQVATELAANESKFPEENKLQWSSDLEEKSSRNTLVMHEKPPLPTKGGGLDLRMGTPQSSLEARPSDFASKREDGYLVNDPEKGVHRNTRRGFVETVGAVVDGLKVNQGFLKPYTQFNSSCNSEDLSVKGSRHVSISSAGTLATINEPQKTGIRALASKWNVRRRDVSSQRPKLRIPRKALEKGLSIAEDSGSTKLTVCNGSLTTIRVDVSATQRLKLKGQVLIQPQFLALQPEQKAVIRLTRLTSEESKVSVVLACSNLDGTPANSCTYRLPLLIEAAKNRVPHVQGFAVDRPTLTFYNPRGTTRHCRVRVLNGTRRKAAYKVWIGKNKEHSPYYESAFSILSHCEGAVEPQKSFSIIVVFDPLGQTDYFSERLVISVGRKTDFIPMFGYGGASNIKFSRSEGGHLRAHNSGCRHGFLVLTGPETESAQNAVTKAVLAPEETRDFIPPYGSGTIIYTGDEIARTRLCRSQDLFEPEIGERGGENNLFVGDFENQERAAEEERLSWNDENKHTLHYAGRLLDSNTRRFMFDPSSDDVIPDAELHREGEVMWNAALEGSKFIHIENFDARHELAFTATGAEPNGGSIPPLGDAIIAAFAETVQIFARGQCRELVSQSVE